MVVTFLEFGGLPQGGLKEFIESHRNRAFILTVDIIMFCFENMALVFRPETFIRDYRCT